MLQGIFKKLKIESHVFQAGLGLTVYPKMVLNFRFTYCHLVSSVIRGMCHHGQFYVYTGNLLPKHVPIGIFAFFLKKILLIGSCIKYAFYTRSAEDWGDISVRFISAQLGLQDNVEL